MNRRTVTRILLRAVALQAVVYAAVAFFGPCRPAPPARESPVADRRHILEWLPIKRRHIIEQVLSDWRRDRLPNGTFPFGVAFAYDHPGAYLMMYTHGERATIVVAYSAANEQIAIRYDDQH